MPKRLCTTFRNVSNKSLQKSTFRQFPEPLKFNNARKYGESTNRPENVPESGFLKAENQYGIRPKRENTIFFQTAPKNKRYAHRITETAPQMQKWC